MFRIGHVQTLKKAPVAYWPTPDHMPARSGLDHIQQVVVGPLNRSRCEALILMAISPVAY